MQWIINAIVKADAVMENEQKEHKNRQYTFEKYVIKINLAIIGIAILTLRGGM